MLRMLNRFFSIGLNSDNERLKQELTDIIIRYKERGLKYEQNNAYHMGGHNVGSDMVQASYFTEQIINSIKLSNDYGQNCLFIHEQIMQNLSHYENTYVDSEGYGSSTVQEIANDIKALNIDENKAG